MTVEVTNKAIPRNPRSKNYSTGSMVVYSGGSSGSPDTKPYLPQSTWESTFKLHYDNPDDPEAITSIEALGDFWSKKGISVLGLSDTGGSGGASSFGQLVNVGSWADEVPTSSRIAVQKPGATHWESMNLNDIVGLDESALGKYLTDNRYITQDWILGREYITPSYLTTQGYATQSWVSGQGFALKSDLDKKVSITDIVNNLTSSDADKPLSANQGKVIWDFVSDLFEKVNVGTLIAPVYAIRAKYGLYSDSFVSAMGVSQTGGGSIGTLSDLLDVNIPSPTNGQVLTYDLSTKKWIAADAHGGLSQVTIKLGSTSYASVDGVVSLPAYPTMPDLGKYVTLDTDQTITGTKKFAGEIHANNWLYIGTEGTGIIQTNTGIRIVADTLRWRSNAPLQTDNWFRNTSNNHGLYNEANDARWFSESVYWKSDKDIMVLNGKWFMNATSGNGLYNAQENARWYAQNDRWNSDKEISVNGYGVYHTGNIITATAGYANATSQLQAFTEDNFTGGDHYIKAIREVSNWNTRLWMCYNNGAKQANAIYVHGSDYAINADMVDNLHISYDVVGDTVAARTAEGYIKASYFYSTNVIENIGSTFITENGEGFFRKSTWNYAQNILNHSQQTLDLRDAKYDQNTWYPCTVYVSPGHCTTIKIFTTLGDNTSSATTWASHQAGFTLNLQWSITGNGWGTTNIQRTIKNSFFLHVKDYNPCGGIDQSGTDSQEIVWLRGGALYRYNINNNSVFIVHKDGFTSNNGVFYRTRNSTQLYDPSYCYNTSMFAATNIYTNGLKILELPSIENTWNNRFNYGGGAIVQTTPYNGPYDQMVTAYSYQPLIRWKNTISGVDYRTTYAIGSEREGNTWGNIVFSVSNTNDGTNGHQLKLRGIGQLYWSGEMVAETNITCKRVYANGLNVNGDIACTNITSTEYYARDWYRSLISGTGWYSEPHGGGIYMNDNMYVKVYNGKSFRVDGIISAGESTEYYYGYVNVARSGSANNQSCFAMIRPGYMGFGIGYNTSNQVVIGSASPDRYVNPWLTIGSDTSVFKSDLYVANLFSYGAVTALYSSDARLKDIFDRPDYIDLIEKFGSVEHYKYNDIALDRNKHGVDDKPHYGLIYQRLKEVLPNATFQDSEGYGSVNYLSPDILSIAIGAIQQLASELNDAKKEINQLKKGGHYAGQ